MEKQTREKRTDQPLEDAAWEDIIEKIDTFFKFIEGLWPLPVGYLLWHIVLFLIRQ